MRAMQPLLEQVLAEMESQMDTAIDGVERGEPLSLRSTFSSGSCAGTFGTFRTVGQYGGCLGLYGTMGSVVGLVEESYPGSGVA
jgi:hypothetical protein